MKLIDKFKLLFVPSSLRKLIKYVDKEVEIDLIQNRYDDFSFKKIQKYINKDIKSLKILLSDLDDLDFLTEFSNLQVIDFGDSVINKDILDKLVNTSVKKVISRDVFIDYENVQKDLFSIQAGKETSINYKGIEVYPKTLEKVNPNDQLIINTYSCEEDKLSEMFKNINFDVYKDIIIKFKNGEFKLSHKDRNIVSFDCSIDDSLNDFLDVLNFFTNNNFSLVNTSFNINTVKEKDLSFFYELISMFKGLSINLNVKNGKFNNKFSFDYGVLNVKSFYIQDMSEIKLFYDFLSQNGFVVRKLLYNLRYANKYDEDYDYNILKDISKKTDLIINYNIYSESSVDDYLGLVSSIRWYRKLINDSNLSPLEKYMYAYDLVKTFSYNYNPSGDAYNSRLPHKILKSGEIVCIGYTELLREIINGIDKNISVSSTYSGEDHSVLVVRADDDKYNIHGIYVSDPTNDSYFEEYKRDNLGLGNDYNGLDLYNYFLIPIKEFIKVFDLSLLPHFFKTLATFKEKRDSFDSFKFNVILEDLFGEIDEKKANTYIYTRKLSLENFTDMLINVRLGQGFTKDQVMDEVNKVIRINREFLEYQKFHYGFEKEFFQSEEDKNQIRFNA